VHSRAAIPFATAWYYAGYKADIDLLHFLTSAIGYSGKPAAPLWSLYVELIGCALIPIVAGMKAKWAPGAFGVLLLGASFLFERGFHFNWPVYLIDFYVGVSIGWWGRNFAVVFERLPTLVRAIAITSLGVIFFAALPLFPPERTLAMYNFLEMLSVAPIVALLFFGNRRFDILSAPFIRWLGDISFSVYLLHYPIMYLLVHLLAGNWPEVFESVPIEFITLGLATMTLSITVIVSGWTYRAIELPCLKFGQLLASRLQAGGARLCSAREA
jgi:peptidoglycan/LPS O-acetylase OafA/YrhL